MNLAGLLAQNEFLDLQQLESSLKIDLKETRRSTWEDAQSESMYKNELMILSKKGRMLIYYPFDFFEEHLGTCTVEKGVLREACHRLGQPGEDAVVQRFVL